MIVIWNCFGFDWYRLVGMVINFKGEWVIVGVLIEKG